MKWSLIRFELKSQSGSSGVCLCSEVMTLRLHGEKPNVSLVWQLGMKAARCAQRCKKQLFLPPQIFDEEYAVLYLDQGGALVAIRHTPLPIRHLW